MCIRDRDMKIELTIIIPVYNVEKYIEKCIQSVINQTYDGGIECIIAVSYTHLGVLHVAVLY